MLDANWNPGVANIGSVNFVNTIAFDSSTNRVYIGTHGAGAIADDGTGSAIAAVDGSVNATGTHVLWVPTVVPGDVWQINLINGSDVWSGEDNIIHVYKMSDGTTKLTVTGFNNTIDSMLISGPNAYIGGQFTQFTDPSTSGTVSRNHIAALSTTNGAVSAFQPTLDAGADVESLAVDTSKNILYMGGISLDDLSGDGNRHNLLGADMTSAAIVYVQENDTSDIFSIAVDLSSVNHDVLVAGSVGYLGYDGSFGTFANGFRKYSGLMGAGVNGNAAWLPTFSPVANNISNVIVTDGTTVYAGGGDSEMGGQGTVRHNLAAIDNTTGNVKAFDLGALGAEDNPVILSGAIVNGILYFGGGQINTVGGLARGKLFAVDPSGPSITAWDPQADGDVFVMRPAGSKIYVGGLFTHITDTLSRARAHAAAIGVSGTGTVDTNFNPNVNTANNGVLQVDDILLGPGSIYLSGGFGKIGATVRTNIAAVDRSTGAVVVGWSANASKEVHSIATDATGSGVWMTGEFTTVGGTGRTHCASVNTTTGALNAWAPTTCTWGAIAIYGNNVFLGTGDGSGNGTFDIFHKTTAVRQITTRNFAYMNLSQIKVSDTSCYVVGWMNDTWGPGGGYTMVDPATGLSILP
ncbi:MAG: hypothetical protein ACXVBW_09010, partial [Bdellovibrionota bacterium]